MAIAAPELDRERLTAVAAGALGRPIDALSDWTVAPIGYAAFNPVCWVRPSAS